MGDSFVTFTVQDDIATVVINHPPANSLSTPVMADLERVFNELASLDTVKAVVFTGAGTFFITGADIKEISTLNSAGDGEKATRGGQGILNKIEGLYKPVIAAINGMCLGGGLELAMACHMRVASERARFGQPEINLGLIPGFGGTQRLPRLVGQAKAIELILTGDMITAQEAKTLGLINKVVPESDVLKQAQGLAKKIASKGQVAVRHALRAIREGGVLPMGEGLALESRLFGQICETQDKKEGLMAFVEKRQPKFQDK